MFSKHEETVMHDLVNLLNQARSMGLAAGEIYTVADLMEDPVYHSGEDYRDLTEAESRRAIANINQSSETEDLFSIGREIDEAVNNVQ